MVLPGFETVDVRDPVGGAAWDDLGSVRADLAPLVRHDAAHAHHLGGDELLSTC